MKESKRKRKIQTKFTIDDVMIIQNYFGVGFGPRVCTHNVGVSAYFGIRRTDQTLPTPN